MSTTHLVTILVVLVVLIIGLVSSIVYSKMERKIRDRPRDLEIPIVQGSGRGPNAFDPNRHHNAKLANVTDITTREIERSNFVLGVESIHA